MNAANKINPTRSKSPLLLPKINSPLAVLFAVLIGELFAIILTLAQNSSGIDWQYLGLASLRVQWLSLTTLLLISVLQRTCSIKSFWQLSVILFTALSLFNIAIDFLYFSYFNQIPVSQYTDSQTIAILKHGLISTVVLLFLLRYFYLQHLYQLRLKSESESRFKALQARIHPHFLFNALNAVTSLISTNSLKAEEMLENLADLLRASLNENRQVHGLDQEISLCQKYLDIERCRFADRLSVHWYFPEKLPAIKVPVLLLQPLLENAIIHGISPSIEGGTINISIDVLSDIRISIENPFHENYRSQSSGFQIALANCRERLKLSFGDQAQLKTENDQSVWTTQVIIPKQIVD